MTSFWSLCYLQTGAHKWNYRLSTGITDAVKTPYDVQDNTTQQRTVEPKVVNSAKVASKVSVKELDQMSEELKEKNKKNTFNYPPLSLLYTYAANGNHLIIQNYWGESTHIT